MACRSGTDRLGRSDRMAGLSEFRRGVFGRHLSRTDPVGWRLLDIAVLARDQSLRTAESIVGTIASLAPADDALVRQADDRRHHRRPRRSPSCRCGCGSRCAFQDNCAATKPRSAQLVAAPVSTATRRPVCPCLAGYRPQLAAHLGVSAARSVSRFLVRPNSIAFCGRVTRS